MSEMIEVRIPDGVPVKRQAGARTLMLTREQAREMYSSLAKSVAGRPKLLEPCRYCGVAMGFRERRAHEAGCPQRAKALARS